MMQRIETVLRPVRNQLNQTKPIYRRVFGPDVMIGMGKRLLILGFARLMDIILLAYES